MFFRIEFVPIQNLLPQGHFRRIHFIILIAQIHSVPQEAYPVLVGNFDSHPGLYQTRNTVVKISL